MWAGRIEEHLANTIQLRVGRTAGKVSGYGRIAQDYCVRRHTDEPPAYRRRQYVYNSAKPDIAQLTWHSG